MGGMAAEHGRRPASGAPARQFAREPASQEARRGLAGGGTPLGRADSAYFQARFGWDFGGVRVHAGPDATRAADRLGARAFTLGRDVAFGPGEYAPGTENGRALLAHELAHVVQQSRGGPAPDPAGEPSLEADADRGAAAALAGQTATVSAASGVGVARQPKDDDKKPDDDPPFHFEPVPQDPARPGPAWRYVPDHPSFHFQLPTPKLVLDPKLHPPTAGPSPDDPQAGTPTGGAITVNAQTLDPHDYTMAYGLSHPLLGSGGFAPSFQLATGLAKIGDDAGFELGASTGAPGGSSTSALVLPHFGYAPSKKNLNLGLLGNAGVTGGTSPPGHADANFQAGLTPIVEFPIGDRDHPSVLPSLQGSIGYNRFAPVGSGFGENALTYGGAANLQFNPSYYTAEDGTQSKTAKDTIFLEGAYGGAYGLSGDYARSDAVGGAIGYQHNFRLGNGHLIVSPMVYAGAREEWDHLSGGTSSQTSLTLGGGLTIAVSPFDKKAPKDDDKK